MDMDRVPQHVAIILDGNGRWAKKRGLPRNAGHAQGAKNIESICRAADSFGVKYLTIYAFSTENWSRPKEEVDALMRILREYMKSCLTLSKKNNMRVKVIGDKTRLDPDLQEGIATLEEASAGYTGLTLSIALNYGGQDEIVRGVKKMLAKAAAGEMKPEDLTVETFADYLDTKGIPEPDLLIRTSGEQRVSNFLIWQMAYTELYFTPVPWPAFDKAELEKAIEDYQRRDRRFGGLSEEQ
ncbi:MAG: isoprenyl transferase [Lachnospiraceae bacterium]|nr:isoprenyl transferase [Lachnospiraceae bacterium]